MPTDRKWGTYHDERSRRVVFLGHCLLNQNVRAFGVGVTGGAAVELVRVLLENGIGLEQLPCPECEVWGGISRWDGLYRWQPLAFTAGDKWWFALVRPIIKLKWFLGHRRASRRAARRAVAFMHDHIRQGYQVLGVVTSDDSPTCGVTRTVDLLAAPASARKAGLTLADMEEPNIAKLRDYMRVALIPGSGALVTGMVDEFARRKLPIRVIGWDPWADPQAEAARVLGELGLTGSSG